MCCFCFSHCVLGRVHACNSHSLTQCVYRCTSTHVQAVTRGAEVALAKQFATDTAASVAGEAASLMGGAGMLMDHPLDRITRDLRTHTVASTYNDHAMQYSG